MLQISQICRDRVPRSRFRRSRVDHCGCAWHFWIMSLGVLAPPGDGFHGPVPHGAQGLAPRVWFKLCYNHCVERACGCAPQNVRLKRPRSRPFPVRVGLRGRMRTGPSRASKSAALAPGSVLPRPTKAPRWPTSSGLEERGSLNLTSPTRRERVSGRRPRHRAVGPVVVVEGKDCQQGGP